MGAKQASGRGKHHQESDDQAVSVQAAH
jgi:hypothetical protein